MDFSQFADGFVFLAIASGTMCFFWTIFTAIAVSDEEDYAGFCFIIEVILVLIFLFSGFMGFSLK